jgi:hypothetical protein
LASDQLVARPRPTQDNTTYEDQGQTTVPYASFEPAIKAPRGHLIRILINALTLIRERPSRLSDKFLVFWKFQVHITAWTSEIFRGC